MSQISTYILTKNSEKYLSKILDELEKISDEILIIDSGSTDNTESIVSRYKNAKFCFHEFRNFKDQRLYAEKACTHDMVLFLDSDEIPNSKFIQSIKKLKKNGFEHDAYRISRTWNVLGKDIGCIYPITSPDHPVRLYNRKTVSYKNSQLVHESLSGYHSLGKIKGDLKHFTFETKEELKRKVQFYTDIAAQDLILKRKGSYPTLEG